MNPANTEGLLQVTSVGGMLIFLSVFTGVVVWVLTRRRGEVDDWSHLPLEDRE